MNFLKKVNALVLGLAVLLAVGCGEEAKKEDPTPENPVQKNCLLSKETNFQGYVTEYHYNSAGNVESIDYSDINAPGYVHHAYQMSYNADGNITEKKFFQPSDNLNDQTTLYTYNTDKLLVKRKNIMLVKNVWEDREIHEYKYNAAKQLIKESYRGSGDTTTQNYALYSYPAPDHVVVDTYFKDAAGNYILTYNTHFYFDNKNYHGSSLGYLRFPDDKASLLKRNIISYSSTDYRSGKTTTNTTAYVYNEEGYPVQIVNPATGAASTTFDYSCQ